MSFQSNASFSQTVHACFSDQCQTAGTAKDSSAAVFNPKENMSLKNYFTHMPESERKYASLWAFQAS